MNSQPGKTHNVLSCRSAGVLLHPTSLPATEAYWEGDTTNAFGTLGQEAYNFLDFMAAASLTVWQTLPLGPTGNDLSPYQSISAHAGNPDLISLVNLAERGWVESQHLILDDRSREGVRKLRRQWAHSFFNFIQQEHGATVAHEFNEFCSSQSYWLDDFVLFCALHAHFNGSAWTEWPEPFRLRDQEALRNIKRELSEEINFYRFEQFAFSVQWHALKNYANQKCILILGDMPIYVGHDSADVWAQPHYFKLGTDGQLLSVAGVPPTALEVDGQCWGNPLYAWESMQADGFQWWLARFKSQAEIFDGLRIDHFRGLEAYWEIPGETKDAASGNWVKAPGDELLQALRTAYPDPVLVAENLGIITDEVENLRSKFALPGMLVLHFAFENGENNAHLPHHHALNNIIYTGTHDSNTTLGWYSNLPEPGRQQLANYSFDSQIPMPWLLINVALSSPANLAVIPMQDFLQLDECHRMNIPGTSEKNWRWKFSWEQVDPGLAQSISAAVKKYHRNVSHGD